MKARELKTVQVRDVSGALRARFERCAVPAGTGRPAGAGWRYAYAWRDVREGVDYSIYIRELPARKEDLRKPW
jgi:hypothetical protein